MSMIRRPDTAFSLDHSTKRQKRIVDDAHLAFIRKLPSVISGHYGCEACHIRYGSALYRKKNGATGMKPDDAWTVPMTPGEHRSQHDQNEREFWLALGIDPLAVAADLYAVSGDQDAATKILHEARRKAAGDAR